jgi:endoglucanase
MIGVLFVIIAGGALVRPAEAQKVLYDDALASGWSSYSWAKVNVNRTNIVHSGTSAISVDVAANSYGALELRTAPFDASQYKAFTFWINGGPTGGQSTLVVKATVNTKQTGSVSIPTLQPNTWTFVSVPLDALGVAASNTVTGFLIQNGAPTMLPTFYVDDIALTSTTGAMPVAAPPVVIKRSDHPMAFTGTNISGGEFAHPKPGVAPVYGTNFTYPTDSELTYFTGKGMNVVRLPCLWEVLQPQLNQPLSQSEADRLSAVVKLATDKGMRVLVDPHDYAGYYGKFIGTPDVSDAAFADFWGRLATLFKDNPNVWLGLMNEPHDMPAQQWFDAAQAAVTAIRAAGAKNLILVPGVGWTGAHSWVQTGNDVLLKLKDPANNYIFEAHQYLDGNNSGTHPEPVSATIGSERLVQFTNWCRTNHKQAFLGEFGVGASPASQAAIEDMLGYMEKNEDVWAGFTWWSAGAWWGDYMYTIEPKNGEDRPQMEYLAPHLHGINRAQKNP